MSSARNTSIEAFRFIFMLIICCWHCYGSNGLFPHGYLAVEFYFVLSGYLLYKSFSKPNSLSTIDYTWKKVKRFAPEYVIVVVYIYLRHAILPAIVGKRDFDIAYTMKFFPELLMLQDCGFYEGGVNNPMWYLCVLVIGGGLIYAFLKYNMRLSLSIIFPLISLLGYTFIFGKRTDGGIQVWMVDGFVKATLLRGMAGLSLGVILAYIVDQKHMAFIRWRKLISIMAIMCFMMLLFIMTRGKDVYLDRHALLFIPPIVLTCFIPNSLFEQLFKSRLWILLGG